MEDTPIIHNFSHEAFGSRFWVRIASEDGVYARNAAEALFQLLDDLENKQAVAELLESARTAEATRRFYTGETGSGPVD